MDKLLFFDESFDINKTPDYEISIQVGLNGYSFSVFDPAQNKYLVLKNEPLTDIRDNTDLQKKIRQLFAEDRFMSRHYKIVRYSPLNSNASLIPEEFFDKEFASQYARLNFQSSKYSSYETDTLSNLGLINLYEMDSFITTLLINKYKKNGIKFLHPSTPFLTTSLSYPYNNVNLTQVFTEVYQDFIMVIVSSGGELLFFNIFYYEDINDIVYYLMNVFEKFELNPDMNALIVSGNIEPKTENHRFLKRFFGNMKFRKLNNQYNYSREINNVPEHAFTNLFNFRECE